MAAITFGGVMKYRFNGHMEYVPKNDREWHVERKRFDKTIKSKSRKRAQVKLQILLICTIQVPAERIVFEYETEEINEMD